MDRRDFLARIGATAAFSTLFATRGAFAGSELEITHYRTGREGFLRAPVLITGPTEALLVDGGFTYSDGQALADAIAETGKELTTIYISQSDPDYYFSLKPVVERFPNARVIAASDTRAAIDGNIQKKLETWGPRLGDNGPKTLDDITFPTPFDGPTLSVDGETIEIITATEIENRRYLWVPTHEAIVGGVMVFSGTHVWVADTPTPESRAGWVKELDKMLDRSPNVVIPGHATLDAPSGAEAISFTRDYLIAFDEEVEKAPDSAALIQAMQDRYPDLGLGAALEIGTKVAKGEMKWG